VIHKPPRVLYSDSAAKHVDARAIANAHKNAEGSICIYLMVYTMEDKARLLQTWRYLSTRDDDYVSI
jgi:hypothetical protein